MRSNRQLIGAREKTGDFDDAFLDLTAHRSSSNLPRIAGDRRERGVDEGSRSMLVVERGDVSDDVEEIVTREQLVRETQVDEDLVQLVLEFLQGDRRLFHGDVQLFVDDLGDGQRRAEETFQLRDDRWCRVVELSSELFATEENVLSDQFEETSDATVELEEEFEVFDVIGVGQIASLGQMSR